MRFQLLILNEHAARYAVARHYLDLVDVDEWAVFTAVRCSARRRAIPCVLFRCVAASDPVWTRLLALALLLQGGAEPGPFYFVVCNICTAPQTNSCHNVHAIISPYQSTRWPRPWKARSLAAYRICARVWYKLLCGASHLNHLLYPIITLPPPRQGCEVLWSSCLFVCPLAYLENDMFKFHQIFCECCHPWSLLHRQQCDTLCTSGFVDDVTSSYNAGNRP